MMEVERGLTTSAPSLLTACDEENHEDTSEVNLDDTASVHTTCSRCNSPRAAEEGMSRADSAVAGPSCISGHNVGGEEDDDDDVPPYTALFPTGGSNAQMAYYPAPMPNMCSSSISNENVNCLYSPGTVGGIDSSSLALPVYGSKSNLSDTASAIVPICRICHQPGEGFDILISPCRCAGTLQFIHNTCLMKWLDITSKKSRKPPKCELCHYQYHRHKKFKFNHWRFPKVSRQDKVLHCIFVFNLVIMVSCAIATVMCFLSDKGQISKFPRNKATLTTEEIITLSCGVLFFVSFFIAMSVQIKARRTLYQVFVKFIMQNMEWEIDEYDKSKDQLYSHQREQYQLPKKAMYV